MTEAVPDHLVCKQHVFHMRARADIVKHQRRALGGQPIRYDANVRQCGRNHLGPDVTRLVIGNAAAYLPRRAIATKIALRGYALADDRHYSLPALAQFL